MKRYLALLFGFLMSMDASGQMTMSDLVISKKNSNHLVHFSNKEASLWVGETHGYTEHFLMGYLSYREQIMYDWKWKLDDKELLRTPESHTASLVPYQLTRTFNDFSEEVFMPDRLDGLSINVQTTGNKKLTWTAKIANLDTLIVDNADKGLLIILLKNELNKFMVVSTNASITASNIDGEYLTIELSKSLESWEGNNLNVALNVAVGSDVRTAARTAGLLLTNLEALKLAKKQRLEYLLRSSYVSLPANRDIEKALAWATLSFDALSMNEKRTNLGSGIYAGYPWFQDYWGRDSFIAMRALTITGQFETVKEHMSSFLRFQLLEDTTKDFGKVPNRARPGDLIYNTADATPRLIIELDRYYRYSGDSEFIGTIGENILAAIEGSVKYRTDSLGFFTHEAADTWMDAKGPEGAYSPRDNRAIDIQSLWLDALEASLRLSNEFPDNTRVKTQELASTSLQKLNSNFQRYFVNTSSNNEEAILFDALNEDGTPSTKVRPNALFALDHVSDEVSTKALSQITKVIGTPFGVMSLAPYDSMFHPFHKYEPIYEQDASYHNGIVWVWNTGEWLSRLIQAGEQDLPSEVIQNYSDIILNEITLGTLPELTDALPRNETSYKYPDNSNFANISRIDQLSLIERKVNKSPKPALSGTFSQAWSLSEFMRIFYEDLIGVQPKEENLIEFKPNFVSNMDRLSSRTKWKNWMIQTTADHFEQIQHFSIKFEPKSKSSGFTLRFISNALQKQFTMEVAPESTLIEITVDSKNNTITVDKNGNTVKPTISSIPLPKVTTKLELWDYSQYDHNRITFTSQLD